MARPNHERRAIESSAAPRRRCAANAGVPARYCLYSMLRPPSMGCRHFHTKEGVISGPHAVPVTARNLKLPLLCP